ncbi:DUF445 domain-containing protein [Macrococcus epidermidis]|uniref:DUF445 domain-containing protein n=1 Tax=Macrococcus epidermidis TaxID=1902580 RepID=A0A327ZRW1_9STAP|nr:DUF445 family protein [Macrococcus epidermidis]MCG7420763.1 DUF445 family protein [Macrococcus epidermidis]RAK44294.1 DUF445 domain-containing protein [Macrococcus epidermidis]UTH15689.1 DUF445 domain-containing protein [Macrococcus epidermidis]
MNAVLIVLFMGLIGALIGGFTNYIAIKMLFRPFEPKFLFGKQLPFTPGLIPKRRNELSVKMGEMVTEHLLTPEIFKEKLMTPQTERFIKDFIVRQIQTLKTGQYSVDDFARRFNIDVSALGNEKLRLQLSQVIDHAILTHKNEPIANLLPADLRGKIDTQVESLPPMIMQKLRDYVNSAKGYDDMMQMIDRFFLEKGRVVSMIQMFMTKEMIADRVIKEFNALSREEKLNNIIATEVNREYHLLLTKQPSNFISNQEIDTIKENLIEQIIAQVDLKRYTSTPLVTLAPKAFEYMEDEGSDRFVHYAISKTSDNIAEILEKVHIAEIVKQQIDNFELSFLERLVIEISNKELKMITFLGFLLGGIIGLVQGVIALFV